VDPKKTPAGDFLAYQPCPVIRTQASTLIQPLCIFLSSGTTESAICYIFIKPPTPLEEIETAQRPQRSEFLVLQNPFLGVLLGLLISLEFLPPQ